MRLRREEHGPKIVFIKGIHNTAADAISWPGYDPSVNQTAESYFTNKINKNSKSNRRQNWTAVSNIIVQTNVDTNKYEELNLVFTNHGKEDGIYSLRTKYTL